jgi:hypothetical protein
MHEFKFMADDEFLEKFDHVRALLSNRNARATFAQVFDATLEAFLEANCPVRRNRRRARRKATRAAKRGRAGEGNTPPKLQRDTAVGDSRRMHDKTRTAQGGTAVDSCLIPNAMRTARCGMDSAGDESQIGPDETHAIEHGAPLPALGVKASLRSRHIPAAVRDQVYEREHGRCAYIAPGGRRCNGTHNLHIEHVVPFARGGTHDVANLTLLCAAHNRLGAEHVFGRGTISRCIAKA